LTGDGLVYSSPLVEFDVIVVKADGTIIPVVSFTHQFQGDNVVDQYQDSACGQAVATQSGDNLHLKVSVLQGSGSKPIYVPYNQTTGGAYLRSLSIDVPLVSASADGGTPPDAATAAQ